MGVINVNGVKIEVPDGSTITVVNDEVRVNGRTLSVGKVEDTVKFEVTGTLLALKVDRGNVTVNGNVQGHVDAGGSVEVRGDVGAHVDAGGNVVCHHVHGYVDSGGNVNCGAVEGDVDAGGNVTCGPVKGDIDAGGNISRRG